MIDDFTLKNGATMVGPGSQLKGYFPKRRKIWAYKETNYRKSQFRMVNDRFALAWSWG
jgi:Phytanoyl-CoA dioxygenase (PhyH).